MDITEVIGLIGKPESDTLEYKAVLPPARNIAQLISAFANTNGGFVILGVAESNGKFHPNGLSEDFHANGIVHKAIDLLEPKPFLQYQYVPYKGKRLYAIKVERSTQSISIEGKVYVRQGVSVVQTNPRIETPIKAHLSTIGVLNKFISESSRESTGAKAKFNEHYQSVLRIINDLQKILYPTSGDVPTGSTEGKILTRILFSSCADNFETYLSDLLYEIYLANPSTLKSNQPVSIKEVLDCNDMQEFVIYWSKKRLSRLQRGSVKGFISDNSQIKDLDILDEIQQDKIEKILQIRHLYAHRNGVVDEKFLKFFPDRSKVNDEHQLTINEMLDHLKYLLEIVHRIDIAAIKKYQLATI